MNYQSRSQTDIFPLYEFGLDEVWWSYVDYIIIKVS